MLVQNAFTVLQFGVGIVVISHKRPLLFAVIPCVVSCRARSTFCSAAAMLSAAAALLDPVSHFTLEVLSLSPHTHSLRFGVLGRSNYWPDTPGTTQLYAGGAHHMYIGFPWLPCPLPCR